MCACACMYVYVYVCMRVRVCVIDKELIFSYYILQVLYSFLYLIKNRNILYIMIDVLNLFIFSFSKLYLLYL